MFFPLLDRVCRRLIMHKADRFEEGARRWIRGKLVVFMWVISGGAASL